MKRDFRSCMLYAMFGLPIFLLLFIAALYVGNCGLSSDCSGSSLPSIIHTPIPTLIPAELPAQGRLSLAAARSNCTVTARALLELWVRAGAQESQPFGFYDLDGNTCQATFADVMTLFNQPDLWYPGAVACDSCHNSTLSKAADYMDLSSFAGILAGAKRSSPAAAGEDILGAGVWENSSLYQQLFVSRLMPFGRPEGAGSPDGPTLRAGSLVVSLPALVTPVASEGIARPSNPGGPGNAINLVGDASNGEKVYAAHCQVCHGEQGKGEVDNPGSDDGTIPPLNPIDDTLKSDDPKTYAYNLDLFIQNGSTPPGLNPTFAMPAWGTNSALTQQQLADVIAYIVELNK